MNWTGVSGSWRTTSDEIAVDLRREVTNELAEGNGIVTGGALNVDYEATALALAQYPDGSHIKVILPTSLDIYAAHYRKRAGEAVITKEQAEKLIEQLELVSRLGALVCMNFQEVTLDTYFLRNSEVVKASDKLLAFQVNQSGGVQDTVDKAHKKGIPVKLFSYTVEELGQV
jgi:hypothetical protein